jgi:hypothetical protein
MGLPELSNRSDGDVEVDVAERLPCPHEAGERFARGRRLACAEREDATRPGRLDLRPAEPVVQ